jgi:diguanylate cyclase (GGDEF)-like protein/PAS domain S-box-containing protein
MNIDPNVIPDTKEAALITCSDGVVVAWSRGAEILYGHPISEALGRSFSELVARGHDDIASILGAERRPDRSRHGVRTHRRHDGSSLDVSLAVTPFAGPDGRPTGATVVARDLSEPSERARVLGPFAPPAGVEQGSISLSHSIDRLTGAVGRTLLVDRLEHAIERAARAGRAVAVVFLGLDRFKAVNDTFGHAAGDELLASVAARLRAAIRPSDTLARLGGDEFVVLCDDVTGIADAVGIADRMLDCFTSPYGLADQDATVTASLGVAIGVEGATADRMLRDADAAMYRAKDRGRARFELHDEAMRARIDVRRQLEADLQGAIARDEFSLRYQPIVSLVDGSIAGFEALVRWQHPTRGLLGPAMFIPLAEETRLIVPLGRWILETACADAARWNLARAGRAPLGMQVNLSPHELTNVGLVEHVESVLSRHSLPPEQLTLEITETALLNDDVFEIERMVALKHLGVRLALDDFGTGFSSLGHLHRFPLDAIKLDRSFVSGLGTDPRDTTIVTSVIRLSHALDLEVVAEGIETRAQLVHLQELGCEKAQGYYFARPVARPRADELLATIPKWRPVVQRRTEECGT